MHLKITVYLDYAGELEEVLKTIEASTTESLESLNVDVVIGEHQEVW